MSLGETILSLKLPPDEKCTKQYNVREIAKAGGTELYQRSAINLKGSRVGSNYHSACLAARSSLLQITEEILLRGRDDGKSPASQKIHC